VREFDHAIPDVDDPERLRNRGAWHCAAGRGRRGDDEIHEALKDAGVLVTLEGLHPPSMGARVSFASGTPVVTDGPFTESKEVIGGYWMIEVGSLDEAIAWAKRCPASSNEVIEIRQVQEMSDFPEDVQKAAAGFTEMQQELQRSAKR